MKLTPEQLQAWITAASALVNVIGMGIKEIGKLFSRQGVSPEDRAKILEGIRVDAEARAKRADEAAGRA